MENPNFMKDLMNVLKNDTRLHILQAIAKVAYSVSKLQQELKKTGHLHSQDTIAEEYLRPLLEVGLAAEAQEQYYATTFGGRLTELIENSTEIVNFLPMHSECYEETILKALLSGPKTFEDIKRTGLPKNRLTNPKKTEDSQAHRNTRRKRLHILLQIKTRSNQRNTSHQPKAKFTTT